MQNVEKNQAKEVERLTAQLKASEKRGVVPYSQEWNELAIQLNGAKTALNNTKKEIIDIKYEMETAYRTGTMFDWIEQRLEVLEKKTKSFAQRITNWVNYSLKSHLFTWEYDSMTAQIEGNQKAYERYMEEANKVNLSSDWKRLVQNGEYDINFITDPHLADRIQTYQEWYDKAMACKDAITSLKYEQLDLYETMTNQPLEKASKEVSKYTDYIKRLTDVGSTLNMGESASALFGPRISRMLWSEEATDIFLRNAKLTEMYERQNKELDRQKGHYKAIADEQMKAYYAAQGNLERAKLDARFAKD